ncbi:MAG: ABC transporter substrate-binding protein, partial [Bacteroidota bacterium]
TAEILKDAKTANIDWRQFEGQSVRLLLYGLPWQAEFEKHIPAFEELTGIKVVTEVYEMAAMRNKRMLDMVSKAGQYDVWAYMPPNDMLEYYYAGWVEPIDSYLSNPKLTDSKWYQPDDLVDSAKQQGTVEGHLTYVPTTLDTVFLMYREDLFQKYNIKVPETWDEMWDAAKTIKAKEPKVFGIVLRGEGYSAATTFAQFLKSTGVEWLSPTYYKPGGPLPKAVFNDPRAAKALEFYTSILRQFGPPGISSYTWQDSNRLFMDGRAAMLVEDNVFAATFEDAAQSKVAGKVGYAEFPRPSGKWGQGKSRPAVAGYGLAMSSQSKHKGAAWLLMQFASSRLVSREIGKGGSPMARKSVWKDPAVRKAFNREDYFDASLASFAVGDPFYMPRVRAQAEVRKAIGMAISKTMEGADPQSALNEAAKEAQRIIDSTEKKD